MEIQEFQFQLKQNEEYIQLNQLLQVIGVAQTGGHAKLMIQDQAIQLNGETETRVRKKLFVGDLISFEGTEIEIIEHIDEEE